MANGFRLLLAGIFSFATFILAIVACSGSTSNYNPINKIYVAQINFSNLKSETVFANLTEKLSTSALPKYINIGLWSYCTTNSDSKSVDRCVSAHGIQQFDLKSLIYKNVNDNSATKLLSSLDDVILPEKLQDKKGYYNGLSECMFFTLIIGICLMLINFIFIVLRMLIDNRMFTLLGTFFAITAFSSLIVCGGTSVGTYVYIKKILSDHYKEYGIKLDLGRNFFCILWGSILGSLLNVLLWFSIKTRPRGGYITEAPMNSGKRIIL